MQSLNPHRRQYGQRAGNSCKAIKALCDDKTFKKRVSRLFESTGEKPIEFTCFFFAFMLVYGKLKKYNAVKRSSNYIHGSRDLSVGAR